jgi:ABC-2 type transport system ATP-binding protein
MTWTFRVDDLRKTYDEGQTWANDGISISVESGEVFGLLGPNGAGKSTLVKQVIGLLLPSSGSITLGGTDLIADPDYARQLCSYLPQAPMPITSFKVREAIDIAGMIRGGTRSDVVKRRDQLIEILQLEEWRDTLGTKLSGGVKRLVGFAMTVVQPTPIVILDEPTNDVDPLRRRLLWQVIRDLGARGSGVILVTHNVLEAEKSVDRLAIIDEGRLIAEGTPSSLKNDDRGSLRLQLMLPPGSATPPLPLYIGENVRVGNNVVGVIDESRAAEGIAWAQSLMANGSADEYALGATTLEDVYVRLTGERSSAA